MRLTTRNILNLSAVYIRDYSNYNPATCRNGGGYSFGDTLINNGDGTFTRLQFTSGEFCPKCGSWNCCGYCEEDEVISAFSALLLLSSAVIKGYYVECYY